MRSQSRRLDGPQPGQSSDAAGPTDVSPLRWSSGCGTLSPGLRARKINHDMVSNKRRRHTPDQIIRKLAEGNKLLCRERRLKKLVADQAIDIDMLKEISAGNS